MGLSDDTRTRIAVEVKERVNNSIDNIIAKRSTDKSLDELHQMNQRLAKLTREVENLPATHSRPLMSAAPSKHHHKIRSRVAATEGLEPRPHRVSSRKEDLRSRVRSLMRDV